MENKEIQVVEQQEVNAMSIVEGINANALQRSLQSIQTFQGLIRSQFKQDHDFGIIPRTTKPTLLKPGAEKIVMLMGITTEFEIMDRTRDFDNGFFQYCVKCKMKKNGQVITEGVGTANTLESKYETQNPYSIDNTVLKMAKKRALVDGALMIGSLSDIFTQDIEDLDMSGNVASQNKTVYTDRDGVISDAQAKRMYAIANGNTEILDTILKHHSYEDSRKVKKVEYNQICNEIQEAVKQLG